MGPGRLRVFISICVVLGAVAASGLQASPPSGAKGVTPKWLLPSDGAYPVLKSGQNVWLRVSLPLQRVFVMSGKRVLYVMVASTGLDNPPDDATPPGTYHIQRERGNWFYAASEREGAHYWVSWKNHGEYLFHTVPMNRNKEIIKSEAEKLGTKASHGCIRLSVPDAKWLYEHIPYGTRVVIGN